MNRLWVRLSLLYAGVIFVVVDIIVAFFFLLPNRSPDSQELLDAGLSIAQVDAIQLLITDGIFQRLTRFVLSTQLTAFSVLTILFGVLASIWVSYRMTRPLATLEDAARQVGRQDLSYRVVASGTDEMVALAESFNAMAAGLESAEKRRQNLLADVSHELRTPLTVLQGNLRAALDGVTELDAPQIAKLYDQTRQLNHLITDLHDLAQAEAQRLPLNLEALDLNGLAHQVSELFAPLAEDSGVQIVVETPAQPALIQGDRLRLMQVLQNLISNALRYVKSEISLSIVAQPTMFVLTVADDGVGIDAAHLVHIFDRFYRVDGSRTRQTGGSGLGLAIVRSIVEAHGGTVSAESQPNQGTRMIVTLPVH